MPCTMRAASNMIKAFITNKNIPRVKIVMGKVNKIINGFTIALSKASISEKTIAVKKSSMCTPDKISDNTYTITAVISNRSRKFILTIDLKLKTKSLN